MRTVFEVLLVYAVAVHTVAVYGIGNPTGYPPEQRHAAWMLATMNWTRVGFDALLAIAVFGWRIPVWIGLTILVASDAASTWQAVMALRRRRQ